MGTITVSNLGKAYKQYPSRWSRLLEWMDLRGKPHHQLHWVLRDVNFHIQQGEAVGVIGVNGAGKSTLLKMITGTTQPTTGNIQVNGRVAALLELGMGFHPDFTGRQNAYMAGQLLGLSADELAQTITSIEQFADIGEYFDQPVRIYSSGMQARVAFAVATAVSPDILIVDEALSVGDMAFQAKCMHRMQSLLDKGVTVLFVSHTLNQVRQFCSCALYLSAGAVRAWGSADEVCDLYQNDLSGINQLKAATVSDTQASSKIIYSPESDPELRKNSDPNMDTGTRELEFLSFKILDENGAPITHCRSNDLVVFQATIIANQNVPAGAIVGLLIADKTGYHLAACNTNYYDKTIPALRKSSIVFVEWRLHFPFALGEFRIDIGIKSAPFSTAAYDRVFCVKMLSVAAEASLLKKNFGGYLFINPDIKISIDSSNTEYCDADHDTVS